MAHARALLAAALLLAARGPCLAQDAPSPYDPPRFSSAIEVPSVTAPKDQLLAQNYQQPQGPLFPTQQVAPGYVQEPPGIYYVQPPFQMPPQQFYSQDQGLIYIPPTGGPPVPYTGQDGRGSRDWDRGDRRSDERRDEHARDFDARSRAEAEAERQRSQTFDAEQRARQQSAAAQAQRQQLEQQGWMGRPAQGQYNMQQPCYNGRSLNGGRPGSCQ